MEPDWGLKSSRATRVRAVERVGQNIGEACEKMPAAKPRICMLAHASRIQTELQDFVASFGFEVRSCETIAEALKFIDRDGPAVCVVDIDLTQSNGPTIIRELAERSRCGLIAVSTLGDVSDRVLGLELGADDYLTRPFEPRELVARIRSLIRRSENAGSSSIDDRQSSAHFGDWTYWTSTLELRNADGRLETLTAAEANLLMAMITRPNRLLTREQLQRDDDWTDDPAFERSIDVRISRIRKKIEEDARSPRYIKTVYGAGYIFSALVSWK